MKIGAGFVLANCLLYGSGSITFGDLRRVRNLIEEKIAGCHVDISTPSIASAVEIHPHLFRWCKNGMGIEKGDCMEEMFSDYYIQDYFYGEREEDENKGVNWEIRDIISSKEWVKEIKQMHNHYDSLVELVDETQKILELSSSEDKETIIHRIVSLHHLCHAIKYRYLNSEGEAK